MYVCMYVYCPQQKQVDEINYYKEENGRLEKQVFYTI